MNLPLSYKDFLRAKIVMAPVGGFEVADGDINPLLKPHQRAIVKWAILGGRRAIFAAFGLGKTIIQLEILRIVRNRFGGKSLICAPLGVRREFFRDAHVLETGDDEAITGAQRAELRAWLDGHPERLPRLKFIRSIDAAEDGWTHITNYETVRDGKLDPRQFDAASLDEASCLRGFGGTKTFREFMRLFDGIRFKFVATATPSPNEYVEMLAYSAFLEVMDVGQAKTRFFRRNSEKADQLTIHAHKQQEFWLWVASWGLFVQKPSDLGFSDDGYELPGLDVHWHEIPADHENAGVEKSGQGRLLRNAAASLSEAAREKRDSIDPRVAKVMEIIHAEQGRRTGVSAGVLPEEPGASAGRTTGTREEKLCGEARGLCEAASQGEIEELRPRAGYVPGHAGRAGRRLRDLHSESSRSSNGSGPRPPDGEGEGHSLPAMQHGSGPVGRLSGTDTGSGSVPDQIVLWCDLNDEQGALERALVSDGLTVSSLYGSQPIDEREVLLQAWRDRWTQVFLSKPMMYGAGVNLQQAHTMVFAGIGFKFSDIIQAVHRCFRFLQRHRVQVHFVYTEAERPVRDVLEAKWRRHDEQVAIMTDIIRKYGLSSAAMAQTLQRAMGVERVEVSGEGYRLVNNDCVEECQAMEANSVDLIVTSIPFSTQYEYSPNYADFGHTDDNEHFWRQMDFLIPELFRVLKPGRVAAIHVKDRIVPGGMNGLGFQTVYPFADDCTTHFRQAGFAFLSRKTITTDVVRENNQTYRLGWTEQCKDGSRMGNGLPEYLLIFRKPPSDNSNGYADDPVVKAKKEWDGDNWSVQQAPGDAYSRARWQLDAHGYTRSSGDRLLAPEELHALDANVIFKLWKKFGLSTVYDFEHHVRIAESLEERGALPSTFMLLPPHSPHDDVWTDITRMLSMNTLQAQAGREMHLCPLQFDIVDRAITQYSEPGELVFDPFGGLMTVPYRAIKLKRRGAAVELNPTYFLDGCEYVASMAREMAMPSLFDLMEGEAPGIAAE